MCFGCLTAVFKVHTSFSFNKNLGHGRPHNKLSQLDGFLLHILSYQIGIVMAAFRRTKRKCRMKVVTDGIYAPSTITLSYVKISRSGEQS